MTAWVAVKVLAVGLFEHIAVELACSVIKVVDIEDVIEEGSPEEQTHIKILVAESMCRGHGEFGKAVADYTAVVLASLASLNHISVLVFNQPFSLGIDADVFPQIEIAYGLPFFYALQIVVRIRCLRGAKAVVVLPDIFRIAEIDELVGDCGSDYVEVVSEITGVDCIDVQVELETIVFHGPDIDECLIE